MRDEATCQCVVVRHTECPVHGMEFGVPRVVSNAEIRAFLETLASEPAPPDAIEAWRWANGIAQGLLRDGR
jgi:hypothetical protein